MFLVADPPVYMLVCKKLMLEETTRQLPLGAGPGSLSSISSEARPLRNALLRPSNPLPPCTLKRVVPACAQGLFGGDPMEGLQGQPGLDSVDCSTLALLPFGVQSFLVVGLSHA